jgi:hypothetical protein
MRSAGARSGLATIAAILSCESVPGPAHPVSKAEAASNAAQQAANVPGDLVLLSIMFFILRVGRTDEDAMIRRSRLVYPIAPQSGFPIALVRVSIKN